MKNPEKEPAFEKQEKRPFDILGKVTIFRHGETKYTEQYPDLTEIGKQQLEEGGEELKEEIDRSKEEIWISSSPAARAQGSADILAKELGIKDKRIAKALRGVEIRDREEALKMINDIIGPEQDIAKMDKAYADDPQFEERVDVWEPRSEVEKRTLKGIEIITRLFTRYGKQEKNKIPHLVSVSHYEFFNHLIRKVFNVNPDEERGIQFGEKLELTLLKKNNEEDKERVPILVTFRGQTKEIVFDRKTRSIDIAKEE
ncbi:histidine phosphatase family protein [Patescibacteria group bacterium]|nr:histidine phosphatase family protein [Patescibacteria group bacterium]